MMDALAEPADAGPALAGLPFQDPYYESGQALNLGPRMQLFLDSSSYADRWDVRAVVNTPIKSPRNPVVEPDQLWETAIGLPNVLFEKETQTFHMWYATMTLAHGLDRPGRPRRVAHPT